MDINVVYLTLESYERQPILKSQVFPLLKYLGKDYDIKNNDINYYFFTLDKKKNDELNVKGITHCPITTTNYFLSQFYLLKELIRLRKKYQILHVRSYMPMICAVLIKYLYKKKIIFDMRGVFPEEMLLRKKNKFIFFVSKALERLFVRNSDVLVVVSNNFKKHIATAYTGSDAKIQIIPTFMLTDTKREQCYQNTDVEDLRKVIFAKEDAILFAYSGAFEKWQCVDKVFDLFEMIRVKLDNARFLILSHNTDKFKSYALERKIDLSHYHITYVENRKLKLYLGQCNVGVLLREDHLINRVAAPIKFTDYIAANLIVIVSDNIGDTSALVKKFDLGYIASNLEETTLNTLANNISNSIYSKQEDKENRIAKVLNELGISQSANKYFSLYKKLIG